MAEDMYRSSSLLVFAIAVIAVVSGFFIGTFTNRPQSTIVTKVDTLTVRDTIVQSDTILVEKIATLYDTCWLATVDTVEKLVEVQVPIDYSHTKFKDADVYHHGYRSVVDSIIVYPKTKYITKTTTVTKKAPQFSIGVQLGYGMSKDCLSPYLGIGVNYTLFSISK